MGFEQYHEPANELPDTTRTFARMITSLTEEAEAISWYEQRIALEKDKVARAIMRNAQKEEFKHFGMDLEFLLRRPSSRVPHPASLIPRPSSRVPHPASLIPRPALHPVNDPVGQDANIGVFEGVDRLTTLQTARKEGVDRTRDRLENGIVVAHVSRLGRGGGEGRAGNKIRASPRFVTAPLS
jgi:hypothetical protein